MAGLDRAFRVFEAAVPRFARLAAVALVMSACNLILDNDDGVYVRPPSDGGAEDGAPLDGFTLTVVAGNGQFGEVGKELAQPLIVEARDPEGKPAIGRAVRFVAQGGGYFLDSSAPAAGPDGRAQTRLALGPAQKNSVEITLEGTTAKATIDATSKNPWSVTVYAGQRVGRMFKDGKGIDARFAQPRGVAVAPSGHVFIADEFGNAIRRFDPSTTDVVTFAGKLAEGGRAEGVGAEARFTLPQAVAMEGEGRLLVGGFQTQTVHRIELDTAKVSFLAGSGIEGPTDDVGPRAQFRLPRGVAVDSQGKRAFIAELGNSTVRQIDLVTGAVTTLAGAAGQTGRVDGTGAAARFYNPNDVAFDGDNRLFVSDYANVAIRAIDLTTKAVTTFAGKLGAQAYVDGPADTARFYGPHYLAYDRSARLLYVSDLNSHSIRRITVPASGTPQVSTIVGPLPPTIAKGTADGIGNDARFIAPAGIALTPGGEALYVADASLTLRRVDLATRKVERVVGTPGIPRDGAAMTEALFDWPHGLAAGPEGSVIVADLLSHTLRKIGANGQVTTLAGALGDDGGHVDGSASETRFRQPIAVVSDDRYVYATEQFNVVRRTSSVDGSTVTLAGAYESGGGFMDGPGASARFHNPNGMALDSATGELYVADTDNHRIRVVGLGPPVTVSTRAGSTQGAADGNGSAAKFNAPKGLALVGGDLYVADSINHAIRKVELASGDVTTVAGALGKRGFEDGPAGQARFNLPVQLAVDGDLLYVLEFGNRAIRRIHLPSRTVSTLLDSRGLAVGSLALPVGFERPAYLMVRPGGEIFFTERGENVILRLGP